MDWYYRFTYNHLQKIDTADGTIEGKISVNKMYKNYGC